VRLAACRRGYADEAQQAEAAQMLSVILEFDARQSTTSQQQHSDDATAAAAAAAAAADDDDDDDDDDDTITGQSQSSNYVRNISTKSDLLGENAGLTIKRSWVLLPVGSLSSGYY